MTASGRGCTLRTAGASSNTGDTPRAGWLWKIMDDPKSKMDDDDDDDDDYDDVDDLRYHHFR